MQILQVTCMVCLLAEEVAISWICFSFHFLVVAVSLVVILLMPGF